MTLTPALTNGLLDAAIFFAAGMVIETTFALAIIGLAEITAHLSAKRS